MRGMRGGAGATADQRAASFAAKIKGLYPDALVRHAFACESGEFYDAKKAVPSSFWEGTTNEHKRLFLIAHFTPEAILSAARGGSLAVESASWLFTASVFTFLKHEGATDVLKAMGETVASSPAAMKAALDKMQLTEAVADKLLPVLGPKAKAAASKWMRAAGVGVAKEAKAKVPRESKLQFRGYGEKYEGRTSYYDDYDPYAAARDTKIIAGNIEKALRRISSAKKFPKALYDKLSSFVADFYETIDGIEVEGYFRNLVSMEHELDSQTKRNLEIASAKMEELEQVIEEMYGKEEGIPEKSALAKELIKDIIYRVSDMDEVMIGFIEAERDDEAEEEYESEDDY